MAEAKETKVYVHVKSGERRDFVESVYKNLSKTMKALWLPADAIEAQALNSAKSIPPSGITVNSSNKNVDEAHAILGEVFDELGIAKPDGSILDMAITAVGALRSAHAGLTSVKTAKADGVKKEPVKQIMEEEVKAIEDYTKEEIKAKLDLRGIVYGVRDTKEVLLALLKNAD